MLASANRPILAVLASIFTITQIQTSLANEPAATTERIEALDQKIRIIERQRELDAESQKNLRCMSPLVEKTVFRSDRLTAITGYASVATFRPMRAILWKMTPTRESVRSCSEESGPLSREQWRSISNSA